MEIMTNSEFVKFILGGLFFSLGYIAICTAVIVKVINFNGEKK